MSSNSLLEEAFSRRYPACGVDVVLSDARVDLVAGQIDVSIRVGWLDDSSQQARRLAGFRQLLVAGSKLAATLAIDDPKNLATAPFIANGALREPLDWRFTNGVSKHRSVRMQRSLTCNVTSAVLAATLANGGLSVLPDYLVAEYLKSGRLVHVLPAWSLPSGGIHAVYPAARFRPPKVTAFILLLIEAIRRSSSHAS